MRIEKSRILTYLEEEDRVFIKQQLKAKKIKVNALCKENNISRAYFYDMLNGKCEATKLLVIIGYEGIYPHYNIARDDRWEQ